MSNIGLPTFDDTLQKTNALLKDIEAEFGWEGKREYSYKALRSVLHALRDRMTIEEIADLGAQLPMLVRGLYYEQWRPTATPKKMDRIEFLEEIAAQVSMVPIGDDQDITDIVRGVLLALRTYISKGEVTDIVDIMPKDIAPLIKTVM